MTVAQQIAARLVACHREVHLVGCTVAEALARGVSARDLRGRSAHVIGPGACWVGVIGDMLPPFCGPAAVEVRERIPGTRRRRRDAVRLDWAVLD